MAWTTTTEPSLLHRLRDTADEAAWRRFENRYGQLIVSFARRRGLNLIEAEDVRQNVLMSLVRAFPSFEFQPERGRFRSYLGRVVANAVERYSGRPYRTREVLEGSDGSLLREIDPKGTAADDDIWQREWEHHHLRTALDVIRSNTSERSVRAFEHLLAGKSTVEVAAEMGMTVDAVHKAKQRIRDRLRAQVAEQIRAESSAE